MEIAIIGSGGVGGYFGAKLAKAGNSVTFLARGEHLAALRANGIKVKSTLGNFHVDNISATNSIQEIGKVDLIILGVKAWQIVDVRNDLKKLLKDNTIILPLQNGVMAADELKEVIDEKHIIGGLCRIISKIESPGVIHHMGITPTIVFGEYNKSNTDRASELKKVFDKAEIKSQISLDIQADLWKKFISICVSGLLAVTKTTYGELRELKETRQMTFDLMNEIYLLSQKVGIQIEPDFVEKSLSFIDSFPHDSTSSLTRDVWEGKPSEIYYQNGTVVKLAEKFKVDVPINQFVFNCILPMELKARNSSK